MILNPITAKLIPNKAHSKIAKGADGVKKTRTVYKDIADKIITVLFITSFLPPVLDR